MTYYVRCMSLIVQVSPCDGTVQQFGELTMPAANQGNRLFFRRISRKRCGAEH